MSRGRGGIAWIFDLDNTLHDARPHIFPHINRAMTDYLRRHLGLDEAGAGALRREYWLRYGATLLGLIRHHDTDPGHFLWHTHQFPDLRRMVVSEPRLRDALRGLRGPKYLFTNAPVHYAAAVLEVLGVARQFDAVHSIERVRYRPKPDAYGFLRLCRTHHLNPRRCIMVEDTLENLRTAKRLGMKTVWVSPSGRAPGYVDLRIASVGELSRRASSLH
ncbi:MAG: pyrimidine 5'-nucleotidase [Betaproteobacteria bacterium]|nr:pyrimidine 5'-nucleotidase [Betaproteobacteria bacterium]